MREVGRIRTIKPEFFTSEDIVSLSPMARLLYIATWCEADKEGRLEWKLGTFKLRYFPGDNCDMEALANELTRSGLVVLYGEKYAVIPKFRDHQHINPRESESKLPDPDAKSTREPRVSTRQTRNGDAQGGREGKGKEGTRVKSRATSIPEGFGISDRVRAWAAAKGLNHLDQQLEALVSYAKRKGATYVDWDEALMTAIRDDWAKVNKPGQGQAEDIFAGAH